MVFCFFALVWTFCRTGGVFFCYSTVGLDIHCDFHLGSRKYHSYSVVYHNLFCKWNESLMMAQIVEEPKVSLLILGHWLNWKKGVMDL